MADKKISELPTAVTLDPDDLLLVVTNPATSPSSKNVTLSSFFTNVPVTASFSEGIESEKVETEVLVVKETVTPVNSTDVEAIYGTFAYDDNYLYVKVNSTTVKRIALASF